MKEVNDLPDLTAIFAKGKGTLISLAVVVFLIITSISSMFTVQEGNIGVIKRFGQATQQVNPGLHMKIPFVDTVEVMDIRTRKNVDKLNASTHEQMPITADISIN